MRKKLLEEYLKNAMEKGEMKKFLLGLGSYMVSYRKDIETVESIRIDGIYDYYETDPNVKSSFEQGLFELLNGSEYEIYEAFKYLERQVSRESGLGYKPPFELDKDVYIKLRQWPIVK